MAKDGFHPHPHFTNGETKARQIKTNGPNLGLMQTDCVLFKACELCGFTLAHFQTCVAEVRPPDPYIGT